MVVKFCSEGDVYKRQAVKNKCESNFNKLKYELNEKLSQSLKSMNNRINEIGSSM